MRTVVENDSEGVIIMSPWQEVEDRAEDYARDHELTLQRMLGRGNDGLVWTSSTGTAVKAFYRTEVFERERNVYVRLFETHTLQAGKFKIPELIYYDNRRLIIEMGIVSPPCVLDFGKAYVDQPPDYSPEVLAETEAAERELFEEDEWKDVRRVRAALRMVGIYYFDARPSNIMFRKD
jgi:hypothetical protein